MAGLFLAGLTAVFFGCGSTPGASVSKPAEAESHRDVSVAAPVSAASVAEVSSADTAPLSEAASVPAPSYDNTPKVLIPAASGTAAGGTENVTVDTSNAAEGYFMVLYGGNDADPKIILTTPSGENYYYHLHNTGNYETFPLTGGDGDYTIQIMRNVTGDQYALEYSETISVTMPDPLKVYLYPSQYVNFNPSTAAVAKGAELSANALDELDAVGRIYSFLAENIKYDYDKANSVKSGYAPNVDDTLTQKKGICFDYAALMATMLRTQGIPTRLEVGYAGTAYHAWISTHISEIGWVNGIIQFDGQNWTLMDPTMAAAKGEKNVVDYIGDGSNYQTKYIY